MNIRCWVVPHGVLTPRGLAVRALAIAIGFAACHLLGFRDSTSFLCGMSPAESETSSMAALPGLLYVLAYLAVTLAAPVLLMAAILLRCWGAPGPWRGPWRKGRRIADDPAATVGAHRPAGPGWGIWRRTRKGLSRFVVSVVFLLLGVAWIPYLWCSRGADRWAARDPELHRQLAAGVEKWIGSGLQRDGFRTGSRQFDGEWLFGTYMMAGLGYGQEALEHPELRERYAGLMEQCIDRLLEPEVREFDREMWGSDPIESLQTMEDHHAAYLGYFNLLLGVHRLVVPESRFNELNDQITAMLVTRIEESPTMLLQSYPYEVYTVDNCAVIASIGLYGRVTGADTAPLLAQWIGRCRERYQDRETGLLYQCLDPGTGEPIDEPRGSGTTLGLYFISFADREFAAELYGAVRTNLARTVFGFGGVREYPETVTDAEMGDIDSGPVVLGYGLSPTGFMIGGCLLHDDAEYFRRLWATAMVWGAPHEKNGQLHFITGGSIGDAILFAMLTAGPGAAPAKEEEP